MNLELDLARKLLDDARFLLTRGRYRSCVSRAYYAAYHACIALMESFGLRPNNYVGRGGRPAGRWEHGIVTSVIAAETRLSDVVTRPVAVQLRWQYLQRIRGDYRADQPVSNLAAHTSANLAEQVISHVEGHLNAQNR